MKHTIAAMRNLAFAIVVIFTGATAWAAPSVQNGRIAFVANLSGTWQLYTINPDGSDMLQVTDLPPTDSSLWSPDYSPDGQRILFCHDMTGALELYVINTDGTGLTQLTADGGANLFARWSPDGARIVFSSDLGHGVVQIVTMKADGTDRRQLTNNLWDNYQAQYTVDGKHIIFASQMGGLVSAIWIMNTNGSHKKQLTAAPLEAGGPDPSPDGQHMVFYSQQNTDRPTSIWVGNLDGTRLKRLTKPKNLVAVDPIYSPDGTKIVFHGGEGSNDNATNIFTMNADGTGRAEIATDVVLPGTCPDGSCLTPDWGSKP